MATLIADLISITIMVVVFSKVIRNDHYDKVRARLLHNMKYFSNEPIGQLLIDEDVKYLLSHHQPLYILPESQKESKLEKILESLQPSPRDVTEIVSSLDSLNFGNISGTCS